MGRPRVISLRILHFTKPPVRVLQLFAVLQRSGLAQEQLPLQTPNVFTEMPFHCAIRNPACHEHHNDRDRKE